VYGTVIAGIALSGTFETLAKFANLAAVLLYFLCAVAAFILRKRDVRTDGEPFLAPGGPFVPIATCLALTWLFYETVEPDEFVALMIVLAVVFGLYYLRAWRLKVQQPA
jgi:amino acid transporter